MNIIYIDTSSNKEITVRLTVGSKEFSETVPVERAKAEAVLPLVDELVKKTGISVHDIEKITVNRGPGSFTGLRVGVAVANALSFSLGIPVNEREVGEIEEPKYQ